MAFIRYQVKYAVGDIVRLADVAYGMLGVELLFQLVAAQPGFAALVLEEVLYLWRPDEAGMDGVDADIVFSVEQGIDLGLTRLAALVAW